jgi:hypothetical protein
MGFFKALELELSSLAGMFNSLKQEKQISKCNTTVTEDKINETNVPYIEAVPKKTVSKRVMEPLVQRSIEQFNKLSSEEKMNILETCDQKLQDKLMVFMNYNAQFTDNVEKTHDILRHFSACLAEISERKSYTEKELAVLLKEFQRFAAKSNIEAERLINAFTSYRTDNAGEAVKMSFDNKDEHAIAAALAYKKSIRSYMNELNLKLKAMQNAPRDGKEEIMSAIMQLLSTIKIELDDFQSVAQELMNSFIPEAISEENKFYARTKRYVEKGIESDLCIENKIIENILIDTILESVDIAVAGAA